MITRSCEWLGQLAENIFAVVMDFAGLAVKEFWSANDFAAERRADSLMAEANAQDGKFSSEPLDQFHRNASLLRRARPRRNDDSLRLALGDVLDGDFVVAVHFHLAAQLTEVLGQVVGERVVVVEQQDHVIWRLCRAFPNFGSLLLAMRSFKSSEQSFRLIHRLFVFAFGRGVGDNSASCLHMGHAIFDDHGAQRDA